MKPKLRFQGFHDDWEEKKLGEIVEVQMCKRIFKEQTTSYGEIPFFKIGTLGKAPDAFISKELFEEYKKKYNYPRVGEVMMTCSGTVGKSFPYNGYQAYYQDSNIIWLRNDENIVANLFLLYSVKNMTWNTLSSTTIKRIYNKDIYQKKVSYPSLPEQEKIGTFLSQLDDRIEKQEQKIVLLKERKKGWMQKLFSQTIRFKDENGQDYPAWEEKKLGEVLDYARADKYIVTNTDYDDSYDIPVLTANKSFILGYTNDKDNIFNKECIIFDDFTMESKYVNFDFKVKSSAIKILTSELYNIYFLSQLLKITHFISEGHARHYISIVQNKSVSIPSRLEQEKIAEFLSKQDELIEKEEEKLSLLKAQKKGLLQQMFV